MDYKKIAIQIASSEDPYGDFAKEASSLDDMHKTTLAREVNKQFFLSRLNGREADGHIDFDVIQPEITGTHASRSVGDPTIKKVASQQEGPTMIEKRAMVDDSMFVFSPVKTIKAKSHTGGGASTFRKVAEHIIEEELDKEALEENRLFSNDKNRAVAVLNDMFGAEIESITKIANDASELRSVIGMVIDSGLGDIIPEIMAVTRDAESTLLKVASVDMDQERTDNVVLSIETLKGINEVKGLIKEASSRADLEKIAIFPALIGGAASGVFKLGKGTVKALRLAGKAGWKTTGAVSGAAGGAGGAISGAAKGLFSKNPLRAVPESIKGGVKGAKSGTSVPSKLALLAVGGGTAMQVGPAMNKYTPMTLRR